MNRRPTIQVRRLTCKANENLSTQARALVREACHSSPRSTTPSSKKCHSNRIFVRHNPANATRTLRMVTNAGSYSPAKWPPEFEQEYIVNGIISHKMSEDPTNLCIARERHYTLDGMTLLRPRISTNLSSTFFPLKCWATTSKNVLPHLRLHARHQTDFKNLRGQLHHLAYSGTSSHPKREEDLWHTRSACTYRKCFLEIRTKKNSKMDPMIRQAVIADSRRWRLQIVILLSPP